MDRRLYAFVAGTPADLWYREGLSKYLVRLATRGILPDSVRNVAVKVVIDAPTQAIWRANQAWIIDVLEAASALPRAKPLASGLVQLAQQVRGGVTLAPRDGFTLAFALWLTRYEAEEEKRMRSC
jgi:hypothetical protein